jgi:hypothetical protein
MWAIPEVLFAKSKMIRLRLRLSVVTRSPASLMRLLVSTRAGVELIHSETKTGTQLDLLECGWRMKTFQA